MTKVELIELEKNNETINNYKITIDDLINKSNRSLLTGYTEDLLLNWHVYIKEGKIYAFLYGSNCKPCQIDIKENLDNPVNFIKFITDQKIKKLTNGQLKTFLQFINKKHISSINYWERRAGYSTLIAIFILYSMIIKNKKVVLIESTDKQSIDVRELVFKFYRNIYNNLNCSDISSDLLYQKLFNSGNLILVNSNDADYKLKGYTPDIVIIENTEYMNNTINGIFEILRIMKAISPALQLIISSSIKLPEFINNSQFLHYYSIVKNYNNLRGSNIWEMN